MDKSGKRTIIFILLLLLATSMYAPTARKNAKEKQYQEFVNLVLDGKYEDALAAKDAFRDKYERYGVYYKDELVLSRLCDAHIDLERRDLFGAYCAWDKKDRDSFQYLSDEEIEKLNLEELKSKVDQAYAEYCEIVDRMNNSNYHAPFANVQGGTSSGNSKKRTYQNNYTRQYRDPYNVHDYDDPDDFYEDYEDDFEDFEDAEDYWDDARD